jgi:hypothetical protein
MCVKSLQIGSRSGQIGVNSTRQPSHLPISLFIDPETKPKIVGIKAATYCLIVQAASSDFVMFAGQIA